MSDEKCLSQFTTLRVGGPIRNLVEVTALEEFCQAVAAADEGLDVGGSVRPGNAEAPVSTRFNGLLVLGGGSNLLASDDRFEGTVIRDLRSDIHVETAPAGAAALVGATMLPEATAPTPAGSAIAAPDDTAEVVFVTASAGTRWVDLVEYSLTEGLSGLEALAGIPGSVGAAPVQNVGAYGSEVADTLVAVRAWDRLEARQVTLTKEDLHLSYRHSAIKESIANPMSVAAAGHSWGPTGRWVVLEATFALPRSPLSAPVRYKELARTLGVEIGQRAPAIEVRNAVVELRASKGMVLDPDDHDTWSAGSFFTNPLLTAEQAQTLLPPEAPRFAATGPDSGLFKTSAAWLIDHAGLGKGWAPAECIGPGGVPRASLSTKHVLALTNRGQATAADMVALARAVRSRVKDAFGITLVPEPVTLGVVL